MIKVVSISVVLADGQWCDEIYFRTDLPCGSHRARQRERVVLHLDVEAGTALEYCAVNFPGVPVEVEDV